MILRGDLRGRRRSSATPFARGLAERVGFEPTDLSVNGFQDRRNRPLCHLSAAEDTGLRGRSAPAARYSATAGPCQWSANLSLPRLRQAEWGRQILSDDRQLSARPPGVACQGLAERDAVARFCQMTARRANAGISVTSARGASICQMLAGWRETSLTARSTASGRSSPSDRRSRHCPMERASP